MSNLGVFELEFENIIVVLESLPSTFSNCKIWCKNNNPFPYSGWTFSELLTNGRRQKGRPISKICHTYPTMMRLGTVIPYLKKI